MDEDQRRNPSSRTLEDHRRKLPKVDEVELIEVNDEDNDK